jgi:hypothetical protein
MRNEGVTAAAEVANEEVIHAEVSHLRFTHGDTILLQVKLYMQN